MGCGFCSGHEFVKLYEIGPIAITAWLDGDMLQISVDSAIGFGGLAGLRLKYCPYCSKPLEARNEAE